jgi:hypothetical protein
MQPRFPADHHFHGRNRNSRQAPGDSAPGPQELAALTDHALAFLSRQILPAFDASDPRGT